MGNTISVRNGTPVGNTSLCRTCTHAHIQLGYADSEIEVRCGYNYENPRLVPFMVRECTDYNNKLVPTVYEMEKIAIIIDLRKCNPNAGFARAKPSSVGPDVVLEDD
jgi:hypothetical protein